MMVACSCNAAIQEWHIISHHSSPHHLRLRSKFCVMHEGMRHARWLVQYRKMMPMKYDICYKCDFRTVKRLNAEPRGK